MLPAIQKKPYVLPLYALIIVVCSSSLVGGCGCKNIGHIPSDPVNKDASDTSSGDAGGAAPPTDPVNKDASDTSSGDAGGAAPPKNVSKITAEMVQRVQKEVDEGARYYLSLVEVLEDLHERNDKSKINEPVNLYAEGSIFTAAVRLGHLDIVQALVEEGADVNKINLFGDTPIYEAIAFGREAIVDYLLDKGTDVTNTNSSDKTPYGAAIFSLERLQNNPLLRISEELVRRKEALERIVNKLKPGA